jgi:magnesium chelatase accessory protein
MPTPPLSWSREGGDWPNRAASSFATAAGLRFHLQRFGDAAAPALLLLHGTGSSTHSWRDLAPLLAARFDVLALDLPGHAFSEAPAPGRLSLAGMAADIGALLRALGVAPVVAVGHSAGAAIAARMIVDGAIAPRRLIALNGAFWPFGGAAHPFIAPLARVMAAGPLVPRLFAWQAARPGAVERLIAATGSRLDARGVALYRRLIAEPRHVATALQMMANWELAPLLTQLPPLGGRLVLVAASQDSAVPPHLADRVAGRVPGARVIATGGGHLAHEEHAVAIAALIGREADLSS